MGCDGGTIPTRDELVRRKKRPEQKDKDSERLFQWQHCHLTQETLRRPIVSCQLGRLYNKQAVIERLLDRTTATAADTNGGGPNIDHIKSLKDLKELELTPNPSYNAKNPSVGDSYVDRLVSPWICPITGLEMNGRFKFVFDWSSGKVLSERAHKMVSDDDGGKIQPEDLVLLNPADEGEAELMRAKMEARRARGKAEKKAKKHKSDDLPSTSSPVVKKAKSASLAVAPPAAAAAADAAKQSSSAKIKIKTVQTDPTTSEVYKSLFSSHSSAQNKPTGHWVTFDPRYN